MILFCLFFFFFGTLEASSTDRINQNNDQQLWSEEILERAISDVWSYRVRGVQYIGANYRRLFAHQYEAMIYNDLAKCFPTCLFESIKLGPGYNVTEAIQTNTSGVRQWVWFNRLLAENINTLSFYGWKFFQRSRVEYHIFMKSHFEDYGVYRCRILINPPGEYTCLKIKPYIFNEWFFRKNTWDNDDSAGLVGGYYQNRLRLGINIEHFGFYWQWRILKQSPDSHPSWNNTYQIGLQVYL